MADADGVCERVRIVYDDGTAVECDVTPALAASIRRMDWAESKHESRKRRAGLVVKSATDANQVPTAWEDPVKFAFGLFLGESAVWSGPAALWLGADGRPCKPGAEPVAGADGRVHPRRGKPVRCRFCGGSGMGRGTACLNPDCPRHGRDKEVARGEQRALLKATEPVEAGLKGGRA